MKKILVMVVTLAFLLCGCASQQSVKTLKSFSANASVTFRNFKYDCTVVYNGKSITVSAQSTSAAGLVITYDGKTVGITYDDISLSQINSNFDSSNPAVALYEAFECVNEMPDTEISTVKNGFLVQGETYFGGFTLETDSDFYPVSLEFKDAQLTFEFE